MGKCVRARGWGLLVWFRCFTYFICKKKAKEVLWVTSCHIWLSLPGPALQDLKSRHTGSWKAIFARIWHIADVFLIWLLVTSWDECEASELVSRYTCHTLYCACVHLCVMSWVTSKSASGKNAFGVVARDVASMNWFTRILTFFAALALPHE